MGGALSFFGTSPVDAVTGEAKWKSLSGSSSDVRWTPRLVEWAALKQEVGVLAKGEGENQSNLRFVVWWFECLLDDERSKINKSDLSGGCACVRAPTFVAWLSRVRSVC